MFDIVIFFSSIILQTDPSLNMIFTLRIFKKVRSIKWNENPC